MTVRTRYIGTAPRLAVSSCGEGDLVLFLHGVGGNRSNWDEQVALVGRTHLAVAWDARGYGQSEDASGFGMPDLIADIVRLLDHFGAGRAHLVGLSMGALVALSFYFAHPDRVRSLFLANSAAGLDANPVRADEFLESRLRPLQQGRTPADIAPGVARMLSGRNATPATVDRLERSIAALRTDAYISAIGIVSRFVLPGELGAIAVPAHYVAGEDDRVVPPGIAAAAARAIPGCGFTLIERTGHLSNIEAPEPFNAALSAFLAGRAAGGRRSGS